LPDVENVVQEFKYSNTTATRKAGMFIRRSSNVHKKIVVPVHAMKAYGEVEL
jgi:hypothetical protein